MGFVRLESVDCILQLLQIFYNMKYLKEQADNHRDSSLLGVGPVEGEGTEVCICVHIHDQRCSKYTLM